MAGNSPVKSIVVHYSATPRGRHHTVEDIDAWHKARGWKGIGYHYVIYLDGSVHKGRPDNEVGAHVANHNTGTIGICYIGGVDGDPNKGVDTRTSAQTAALISLIKTLLGRYPGARVVGHRDMPGAKTQCPGFDVIPWWAGVMRQPIPPAVPAPADAPVRTPNVTEDVPPPPAQSASDALAPGAAAAGAAVVIGGGLLSGNSVLLWVGAGIAVAGIIAFLVIRSRKNSRS